MIKRYRFITYGLDGIERGTLESPDGPWVKFEDHAADKRELLTALEVLNDLPIEHDSNGHAFKRIACRSIMDHGAELAALIAKHKEG